MTRTEQWQQRRDRYLLRAKRYRNSSSRPRVNGGVTLYANKGGHQRQIGVEFFGQQPAPRVSWKTFAKTKRWTNYVPPGGWSVTHAGGYKKPCKTKLAAGINPRPQCHLKDAVLGHQLRPVLVLSRPKGRMADRDVLSFKAWTYWKIRRKWPYWDPKGRTPLDNRDWGPDDYWRD